MVERLMLHLEAHHRQHPLGGDSRSYRYNAMADDPDR
jgi:hypothetical protein